MSNFIKITNNPPVKNKSSIINNIFIEDDDDEEDDLDGLSCIFVDNKNNYTPNHHDVNNNNNVINRNKIENQGPIDLDIELDIDFDFENEIINNNALSINPTTTTTTTTSSSSTTTEIIEGLYTYCPICQAKILKIDIEQHVSNELDSIDIKKTISKLNNSNKSNIAKNNNNSKRIAPSILGRNTNTINNNNNQNGGFNTIKKIMETRIPVSPTPPNIPPSPFKFPQIRPPLPPLLKSTTTISTTIAKPLPKLTNFKMNATTSTTQLFQFKCFNLIVGVLTKKDIHIKDGQVNFYSNLFKIQILNNNDNQIATTYEIKYTKIESLIVLLEKKEYSLEINVLSYGTQVGAIGKSHSKNECFTLHDIKGNFSTCFKECFKKIGLLEKTTFINKDLKTSLSFQQDDIEVDDIIIGSSTSGGNGTRIPFNNSIIISDDDIDEFPSTNSSGSGNTPDSIQNTQFNRSNSNNNNNDDIVSTQFTQQQRTTTNYINNNNRFTNRFTNNSRLLDDIDEDNELLENDFEENRKYSRNKLPIPKRFENLFQDNNNNNDNDNNNNNNNTPFNKFKPYANYNNNYNNNNGNKRFKKYKFSKKKKNKNRNYNNSNNNNNNRNNNNSSGNGSGSVDNLTVQGQYYYSGDSAINDTFSYNDVGWEGSNGATSFKSINEYN